MRRHGFILTKIDGTGNYSIDDTSLIVQKFDRKKYGSPQEWDVVEAGVVDRPLVTGTSMDDALWRLARLRDLLQPAPVCNLL